MSVVEDIGPPDAKIMLVAEAPGEHEERLGQPFMGSSGTLLKQMLQHSGIDYSQCYVTNVANERPPDNRFGHFYLDRNRKEPSDRLIAWWEALRDKIEKVKPHVVIALGAEALRAITNKRGIETWRGSILTYRDIKVVATYHPSAVMRKYSWHPVAEMDLAKASRESKFPEVREQKYQLTTKPTLPQVKLAFDLMKESPRVSFDIETVGRHVRCIGLAWGSATIPKCIVIPFIKFPSTDMTLPSMEKNIIKIGQVSDSMSSYWNKHDELIVLDMLAELFANKAVQKIGQNSLMFDAPLIYDEFKMNIENHYMDTMHAWHLLYSELPMGLNFLVTVLTEFNNYWTHKETANDMSEWEYCGKDAMSTLIVSYKLDEELNTSGMRTLYRKVNNLGLALAKVQGRGIHIDDEARKEMMKFQNEKLSKIQAELNTIIGSEFNFNSPKQVKELLYDKMKFPVQYKHKKITTDEAAIKKLMQRYPSEKVLRLIVSCRKISKLINTFLDMSLIEGKMVTAYNASGTKGARISSSKTLWGTGMNLQNIPVGKSKGVENIRNLFVPAKGKIFLKADLVQAESMVVGELLHKLGDPTLRNLHQKKDFDIHNWMAAHFLSKPENEVTKKEREAFGKIPNHSGNYGAGPIVMVNKAAKEEVEGINFQVAKQLIATRHRLIPGLKKWWRNVEKQLRSTRTLTTPFGRRRIFFGRLDESTFRDAYSFIPQSTVGEILNMILTKIEMNVNSKLDILLQVHDEIDGELYEEDLEAVVKEIQEAALIPIFINDTPLIIPIEIEVGKNWRDVTDYKEYKNDKR